MMNRPVLLATFLVAIVYGVIWLPIDSVDARTSETITQSGRSARCFHDTELRESIATLKQQGGADLVKVSDPFSLKREAIMDAGRKLYKH